MRFKRSELYGALAVTIAYPVVILYAYEVAVMVWFAAGTLLVAGLLLGRDVPYDSDDDEAPR